MICPNCGSCDVKIICPTCSPPTVQCGTCGWRGPQSN